MNNSKIHTHIDNFKRASSVDVLSAALTDCLNEHGIKAHSFTYYSYHPKSIQKMKYEYGSKPYLIWHQHYLSQAYNDIDSTLHNLYLSSIPIEWNLQDQASDANTQREQQMRLDAIAFGALGGVSIPLHAPNDDFATLTLVHMIGEDWFEQRNKITHALHIIATHYFHHIRRLRLKDIKANSTINLSAREQQCLTLTATRHSVDSIAKALNITPRTVNFHLQNVNKKLGAKNKHESVNIAQARSLICVGI